MIKTITILSSLVIASTAYAYHTNFENTITNHSNKTIILQDFSTNCVNWDGDEGNNPPSGHAIEPASSYQFKTVAQNDTGISHNGKKYNCQIKEKTWSVNLYEPDSNYTKGTCYNTTITGSNGKVVHAKNCDLVSSIKFYRKKGTGLSRRYYWEVSNNANTVATVNCNTSNNAQPITVTEVDSSGYNFDVGFTVVPNTYVTPPSCSKEWKG